MKWLELINTDTLCNVYKNKKRRVNDNKNLFVVYINLKSDYNKGSQGNLSKYFKFAGALFDF